MTIKKKHQTGFDVFLYFVVEDCIKSNLRNLSI